MSLDYEFNDFELANNSGPVYVYREFQNCDE